MKAMPTNAEFAYAEALRAITQQQGVLESYRTRAVALFGAATAAVAFVAKEALPTSGWEWLTVVGFVSYAFAGMATLAVLWPQTFHFSFSAVTMLDKWAGYDENEHYQHLARYLDGQVDDNTEKLDNIAWALMGAIVSTVLSLAAWLVLLVLK